MIIIKVPRKPKKTLEYCTFVHLMSLYSRKAQKNISEREPFKSGPVCVGGRSLQTLRPEAVLKIPCPPAF